MIDAGEGYGGDFTLEDELRDRDDNRFRPIWFNDMGRFWINSVFAKGVFISHAYPTSPIIVLLWYVWRKNCSHYRFDLGFFPYLVRNQQS